MTDFSFCDEAIDSRKSIYHSTGRMECDEKIVSSCEQTISGGDLYVQVLTPSPFDMASHLDASGMSMGVAVKCL